MKLIRRKGREMNKEMREMREKKDDSWIETIFFLPSLPDLSLL